MTLLVARARLAGPLKFGDRAQIEAVKFMVRQEEKEEEGEDCETCGGTQECPHCEGTGICPDCEDE